MPRGKRKTTTTAAEPKRKRGRPRKQQSALDRHFEKIDVPQAKPTGLAPVGNGKAAKVAGLPVAGNGVQSVPEGHPKSKEAPAEKKSGYVMGPNPMGLNQREQAVLAALSGEPRGVEQIIEATKLPPQEVLASLLVLEIKKQAHQLPGKRFIAANPKKADLVFTPQGVLANGKKIDPKAGGEAPAHLRNPNKPKHQFIQSGGKVEIKDTVGVHFRTQERELEEGDLVMALAGDDMIVMVVRDVRELVAVILLHKRIWWMQ